MTNAAATTLVGMLPALAYRVGSHIYAIAIEAVDEVLPALPIEDVPHSPKSLRGMVFVRDRFIPVLNVSELLGLPEHVRVAEPPILLLRFGDKRIGLEVDEAINLIEIPRVIPSVDGVTTRGSLFAGLVDLDGQVIRIVDAEVLVATWESWPTEALVEVSATDFEGQRI